MFIVASNVVKSYKNAAGTLDRNVLDGLSLEVAAGEKVAVMGPSGSGKTTLLNLLGTLDGADTGEIIVGGRKLSAMHTTEILAYRNATCGFVFQYHQLLPQCTLLENVLLPTLPGKTDRAQALQRAEYLMKFMDIWDLRNRWPGQLSGGECQRGAVARALINEPLLLLADEPTGMLDRHNAQRLIELLVNINQQMGITLIIATHAPEIAQSMDKILYIREGKLESK